MSDTATSETTTPSVAPSIADIKAARRTTTTPQDKETTTPSQTPPIPVTAEVDLSETELKQFSVLSKEARRDKARNKELEADAAEGIKLKEFNRLKSEGKYEEAAALLDFDIDAATAARLKGSINKTPERIELDDLKKELDSVKTDAEGLKKKDTDAEKAKAADRIVTATKETVTFVETNKTEFPYLSRNPAWVGAAYTQALDSYNALLKDGKEPKSDKDRELFVRSFLDQAEEDHAATAKIYIGDTNHLNTPSRTSTAANGTRQSEIPTKKLTFEDVRYARRK